MINEPFFQENILATIIRNFKFYLFDDHWYAYALSTGIIFYGLYFVLRKTCCTSYPNIFPHSHFSFLRHNKNQIFALFFCALCLIIYSAVIVSLDDSLFNNYDLMSLNTTLVFTRGVLSYYGQTRLSPISFFDLNIVYAITHNYNLINFYIIAKQVIIAFLFYRFLNFIPVAKRLLTIGVIIFMPAFFWINNIIFPEQNLIIFLLASLIFIKKYSENCKYSNLWYFIVFANLTIYTKESAIIFYSGIFATGILYNVFIEKINLSNIFRPFKLIKIMPVEFLIFIICFFFSIFYFVITDPSEENFYIVNRQQNYANIINLYKLEIITTLLAWLVFIKKIIKKETFANPLFNEGLLMGATFVLLFMIFYLKIIPVLSHVRLKNYYVLLSSIFSTLYIVQNLYNKKLLGAFFALTLTYSAFYNYKVYQNENGHLYREVGDFFASEIPQNEQTNIMISYNSEESDWVRENWPSTFKYYFPQKDIIFKFPRIAENNTINKFIIYKYNNLQNYMGIVKGEATPISGDYYIIKKGSAEKDFEVIENRPHDLVFENKLFRIYKIR